MRTETLVTTCGIVRNRSKPRVGIVNASSLYNELFEDCLSNGIDLTWEDYREETLTQLRKDNPNADDCEIESLFETESQCVELDTRVFLLGAWVKNAKGQYKIDKTGDNGDFALEYNTGTGIVCVEWSKLTKLTHHTSPCYVMSDGSGPCGDLDTVGDSVIAYTLPSEFWGDNG